MADRPFFRTHDLEHFTGVADAAVPSTLNLLLLALMNDISGVQT